MNPKLLASIAILVLLAGTVSAPIMQSAYADDKAKSKKKDAVKTTTKDTTKKTKEVKIKKSTSAKTVKTKAKNKPYVLKGAPSKVTIKMTEGAASNTKCNDTCYAPSNIKVALGGTILWDNVDSAAHTATASDGSFDSGLLLAGKSFSYKFDTAGTFGYACTVHPWMKGIITVE
ncbi:MAG: hypothetical protein HZC29_04565 [Thaumarchaeota archaeon]|nr:hypothetical protein [Nitrososphaerota archaeon]